MEPLQSFVILFIPPYRVHDIKSIVDFDNCASLF